jgi:hypothetical protein
MFMQIFNEINARRINDELSVFEGFFTNGLFLAVLGITVVFQIIIMQTPVNYIFKVQPLNATEWGATIAIGLGSIPFSFLVRILSRYVPVVANCHDQRNICCLCGGSIADWCCICPYMHFRRKHDGVQCAVFCIAGTKPKCLCIYCVLL